MNSNVNAVFQVRRVGSYALGRRVGAGGMATVFAARQEGPFGVARLVAVKVMSHILAEDASSRKLFSREAGIATRIEHPNVIRTYEVGEDLGVIYLAMEFVHGVRLSSLQTRRMPIGIALRIVTDVALGLHAAHELRDVNGMPLDLIHQDVSPQNIMVGYDGITKLLDFGVARLSAVDGSRTETLRGKPSYLAPEQVKCVSVDRRADVFALGIVLHELLTSSRLFRRDTVDQNLAAILMADIPDVRDERPEVPESIARVVAHTLQRLPEDRYPSAAELREAIALAAARSGVAIADASEVGTWIAESVPPLTSPAELEREIVENATSTPHPFVSDVFDLATVQPQRGGVSVPDEGASRVARAKGTRRAIALGLGGAAVLLAGAGMFVWGRAQRAPASEGSIAAPSANAPSPAPPPSVSAQVVVEYELIEPPPQPRATASRVPGKPPKRPAAPIETVNPFGPAPATAAAQLSVWSSVWGHVSVDGAMVGDSPVIQLPVRAGSHTVSVTTSDGTRQQTVKTRAGENTKVRFVF